MSQLSPSLFQLLIVDTWFIFETFVNLGWKFIIFPSYTLWLITMTSLSHHQWKLFILCNKWAPLIKKIILALMFLISRIFRLISPRFNASQLFSIDQFNCMLMNAINLCAERVSMCFLGWGRQGELEYCPHYFKSNCSWKAVDNKMTINCPWKMAIYRW